MLPVDDFIGSVEQLHKKDKRMKIDQDKIREMIRKGAVLSNPNNLIPAFELIRLHPDELVDIPEFARAAGIRTEEVEDLISNGRIEVLGTDPVIIRRNELRRYLKENDVEMAYTMEDLFRLLDRLFEKSAIRWNEETYPKRERTADFLVSFPDENLVSYVEERGIKIDSVLELGCGHGRNAIYLAKKGACVDAVDMAGSGIAWARDVAAKEGVDINFINRSIYNIGNEGKTYDFVYDHGCFHHQTPHRRMSYVELVRRSVRPGGHAGIVFFNKVVSDHTDWEIYENGSTKDGVPYTQRQIEKIFGPFFEVVEFREMRENHGDLYGRPYLSTVLLRAK